MSYHRFQNEDGEEYGSFEVFLISEMDNAWKDEKFPEGWYWQAGFAGCLPDGDPSGPFETKEEAIADARA